MKKQHRYNGNAPDVIYEFNMFDGTFHLIPACPTIICTPAPSSEDAGSTRATSRFAIMHICFCGGKAEVLAVERLSARPPPRPHECQAGLSALDAATVQLQNRRKWNRRENNCPAETG
jgi:hypothetical protein